MIGLVIVLAVVIWGCYDSPYGSKSNIDTVEKYILENRDRFQQKLTPLGWTFDWHFWETYVSRRVKVSGRHRKKYRYYVTGHVTFYPGQANPGRHRFNNAKRQYNNAMGGP